MSSNHDPLDDLEETFASEHQAEGYRTGLELGKRDGQREAQELGLKEGLRRGSELGFFKGFTMTHKHFINLTCPQQKPATTLATKKMDDILKLIDDFPITNELDCEEKLAAIRTKFKQAFASHPTALKEASAAAAAAK